jgi:hypothetical protein
MLGYPLQLFKLKVLLFPAHKHRSVSQLTIEVSGGCKPSAAMSCSAFLLPFIVLLSHFKPVSGTHLPNEIEVVVQIGVNATETIKKYATLTEFALPTTL